MGSIKKPGPWNPQKATAYVGKGVLKNGGNITPVPNGHLIKKDGTSLKNGGLMLKSSLLSYSSLCCCFHGSFL